MHITASVFINDDESGCTATTTSGSRSSPARAVASYHHNRTGEDNADAHMKRQLMGREVVVAITAGKLDFGPWEQIFYGEFDGRRRKRALVKIIGEQSGPHRVFTMRPPCFHHAATVFSPCGHGVFTMRPRVFTMNSPRSHGVFVVQSWLFRAAARQLRAPHSRPSADRYN